jgi:hypothetical protein
LHASGVYKRYELAFGIAAYHFSVALTNVACAYYGKFDFTHSSILETILLIS